MQFFVPIGSSCMCGFFCPTAEPIQEPSAEEVNNEIVNNIKEKYN